jgi:ergothioneine biosynthesis protein EgtB
MNSEHLKARYSSIRAKSLDLVRPLKAEDYVVQPIVDISPPKWHLGHTTWFFETFILLPHLPSYQAFNEQYSFVFNSYYETLGARVIRTDRGNLSRPTVEEVMNYRHHVDQFMMELMASSQDEKLSQLIELGLQHEQQHQELLLTDIKYILGHNPLFPAYDPSFKENLQHDSSTKESINLKEGLYWIGFEGDGFSFDNEHGRHQVYLPSAQLDQQYVTCGEWLAFMESGGYRSFKFWLSEGWDWVKSNGVHAPLYWHQIEGEWWRYTLAGLQKVETQESVCHISYYEADAFARWSGKRLPTEAEWEVCAGQRPWGALWEWTGSAYLPYPYFKLAEGAIGEYNGKFMVNQMVLRGSSIATPLGHSRPSYRNFFHAPLRWQFTGLRLANYL